MTAEADTTRSTAESPAPEDVVKALHRISGTVHRTPVLTSRSLDAIAGRQILLKAEHLQKTGSYKVRGACNQLLSAIEQGSEVRGLVTSSSGNHGQAVAWLGQMHGVETVVVVPEDIQPHKLAGLHAYGARTVTVAADSLVLVSEELRLADELGYLDIHPFDHPLGIAGQGTAVYEALLDRAAAGIEAVVCPVGGGGLAAGSALAVHAAASGARVYGVEPAGADDTARSMAAGHPVTLDHVVSVADALLSRRPGTTTFPINLRELAAVVTVDDDAILAARELVRERTKQVVEPSGAVALAGVLAGGIPGDGPVLVVLSGGNSAA